MIKRLLAFALLAIFALTGYLYFYLGVAKPVEIRRIDGVAMHLLYKDHLGPYHQINPTIQEVERYIAGQGLLCPRTFGEFLDDPAAVDQDRLRSRAGCVLVAPIASSLPEGLKFESRPTRPYVAAFFKGAPSIGPFKVYPKVEEYFQTQRLKRAGAVMELYEVQADGGMITTYLFPFESP